tara:strand:+ start:273 stop:1865 length:1593 start_codon:yes stop_codon:yes gene_type:complete
MKLNFLAITCLMAIFACGETTKEQTPEIADIEDVPTPSADVDPEDSLDEDVTVGYWFNDTDSLLYVQVYKDPGATASGLAHDHVMRASNWDGLVTYNPADISECSFQFSLPVEDLQVDEDAMREYVGYGDTISTSDRITIREHMLAEDQLNSSQYSDISFSSTGCQLVDEATLRVSGDMTIRDVAQEWDIDIDFVAQEEAFYMSSVIDFTHSDFNITPYSAFFGAVRNSEPLKITFDMVGTKVTSEDPEEPVEETPEQETPEEEPITDYSKLGPHEVVVDSWVANVTNCSNMNYDIYSPDGSTNPPVVVLGHGFARGADKMSGWAEHLSSWGAEVLLPTLCHYNVFAGVDHEMNGQNMTELAFIHGAAEVVYAGHSAGGLAAIIAASQDNNAIGILGLDATDTEGSVPLSPDIPEFLGQNYAGDVECPAFSISGDPSSCNSENNGLDLFSMMNDSRSVKIIGADHCDFESPTNFVCELSCENSEADYSDEEIRPVITAMGTAAIMSLTGLSHDGIRVWDETNLPFVQEVE